MIKILFNIPEIKKYKIILILFLILSFVIVLFDAFSLISLASLASNLIGENTFFYSLLGIQYEFKINEILQIIIFSFLLKNVLMLIYNFVQFRVTSNLISIISKLLFNNFLLDNYFRKIKNRPSELIRKINEDVSPAVEYLFIILNIIKELMILIFLFLILFISTEFSKTLIFLFFGILSIIFYKLIKEFLKKITIKFIDSRTKIILLLNQAFGSIKENFAYGNNNSLIKKFNKSIYHVRKFNFFKNFLVSMPRIIFEVSLLIALVIFIFFLTRTNQSNSEIINTISIIAVTSLRLIPAFNSITSNLSAMKVHKSIFENVTGDLKLINTNTNKSVDISKSKIMLSFEKDLNYRSINFSYPGTKKIIIKNSSFILKKNKSIGIYGESGSGKTTLVDYLLGLLSVENNQIYINNKLIKKDFCFTEGLVGYVPQFPFLLDDTIKNNIIFGRKGKKINKKQITEVLKTSKLLEFVQSLPKKENTSVGNDGSFLSGGQKQRIILARSLIFKPKILVLDEATNALDETTERNLINDIIKMKNKVTILIISHNKETIKKCDIIYRIKNKKIVRVK